MAQLSYGADGNAGPVTCPNGDVNVLAWKYFAPDKPKVMALGPYASPLQVLSAMCADMPHSTYPIEGSIEKISAAYYGWQFGIDMAQALVDGGCPSKR